MAAHSPLRLAAAALAAVAAASAAAPFAAGNLLVLRVGASGSPLAPPNSPPVAAAVFLDELDPAFALAQGPVQSIAAPGVTLTNNDYVLGALSLAADGASAVFGGVGATAGASATGNLGASCVGSCFPGLTRVVARVAWDGGVAASTTLSAAKLDGTIKAVCALDARGYYIVANSSSANAVVGYVPHGSSDGFVPLYSECRAAQPGRGPALQLPANHFPRPAPAQTAPWVLGRAARSTGWAASRCCARRPLCLATAWRRRCRRPAGSRCPTISTGRCR